MLAYTITCNIVKETQKGINGELHVDSTSGICWFGFNTSQLCISLQKHLSYFNHIFRLSQLHQCAQGMLPNRFS